MILWRIAAETRAYPADDLSGAGAAKAPGRWNDRGEPVVYTAIHPGLAVLETAASVADMGLPLNRFLVAIDVPDDVWAQRSTLTPQQLPPAWKSVPAGQASVRVGSQWLGALSSPILVVPSAIVEEESAALINPRHPATATLRARVIRPFVFSYLFRG